MASLDKELPSPPKTPSFYNRLKAMSTRTWSRSESRMSMSRDRDDARPSSAAPSRRTSVSRSNDASADRPQSRASRTKPNERHWSGQTTASTRRQSSSAHQHTQPQPRQQLMRNDNHIIQQAKAQPYHNTVNGSPGRAQTTQPDYGYVHSYQNSPVMPFDFYQQFPRPQMSQNVLRRKPNIIGDIVSAKRSPVIDGRPSLSLDTSKRPQEVKANEVPSEALSTIRHTSDDLKYQIRQPARSLKTPDNPRANSRTTSRAATYLSTSPSSPSTTRHDTPSVFSHASRATSRTAYSPSSIHAMEPHTWTTDPDAPPVPDIKEKLASTTSARQPFVPPELAHLVHTSNRKTKRMTSNSQYPRSADTDEHYPRPSPHGLAIFSDASGRPTHSPRYGADAANAGASKCSPRPLKSMDPTLRARVTLNLDPIKQEETASENKPASKSKTLLSMNRQSASRAKVVDVPSRSSFSSAIYTPRSSLDKNKSPTSYSSARASMSQYRSPRLSIQCQGDDEPASEPVQSHPQAGHATTSKPDRSRRASHSRAFSFSKTPLKTKSSIESLKSKFTFAQRMFNKSVDQLSCLGPVDPQQQQQQQQQQSDAAFEATSGGIQEKPRTKQHVETQPRTENIRLRTKQALNELNLLSSSSRTSIDLPRHVSSKNKPATASSFQPNSDYAGRSSISELSPTSQAAQLHTQKSPEDSRATRHSKQKSTMTNHDAVVDSNSATATVKPSRGSDCSTASPTDGQEFMRFSAMTSVRESSSSEGSSHQSSTQAPPLSRLQSTDSGRSATRGSYGLFPQTKTTPPKSKSISAKTSQSNIKNASVLETAETPTVSKKTEPEQNNISLRLGALTASTAISSKVLFSPVAYQLRSSVGERILVLDGSGEDWSFYCASVFPHANVIDAPLKPVPSTTHNELTNLRDITNHQKIPPFNLSMKFPFPANHFSVVVFRFPPIVEETLLKHIVCEIKRILRPGGYVEIMAIDLDLAKMGSDTRRALRDHKTRLSTSNSNVCLKDPTDNLPRLLTHRNFENLKWCVFSVPAAGDSMEPIDKSWLVKQEPGFGEDSSAKSFSPAEVAQWWYKQCYENSGAVMSIWRDSVVVRECARLQTCFKVLVCYAQKPAMVKRRTVSV